MRFLGVCWTDRRVLASPAGRRIIYCSGELSGGGRERG